MNDMKKLLATVMMAVSINASASGGYNHHHQYFNYPTYQTYPVVPPGQPYYTPGLIRGITTLIFGGVVQPMYTYQPYCYNSPQYDAYGRMYYVQICR